MNSKTKHWITSILAILIVLVLLHFLVLRPVVKNQLEKVVKTNISHDAEFTWQEMDLDYFPPGIELEEIELNADTIKNSSFSVELRMEELEVSGFDLFGFLFNDQIEIGEIELDRPLINLTQYKDTQNKNSKDTTSSSQNNSSIKSFEVESFSLKNGSVKLYKDTLQVLEISELGLFFEQLFKKTGSKLVNLAGFELEIDRLNGKTPDGIYNLQVNNMQIRQEQNSFKLDSLSFTPTLSKAEFSAQAEHEKDRMVINTGAIEFSNLNFDEMLNRQVFLAGFLEIKNPVIEIYKDKRLPDPQKDFKLPSQMLSNLKIKIRLDSLGIRNGNITYLERKDIGDEPGRLTFESLESTIYNLHTFNEEGEQQEGRLIANTKVMGEVLLNADITYPAGFQEDSFVVKGNLKPMNLTIFNPMLIQVAALKIESGTSDQLEFDFTANQNLSSGEMRFYYQDFKMNPVKDNLGNDLKSMVSNLAIINANPKNGDFRVGDIRFEREQKKSIFNYWFNSLMSGFKTSLTPLNNKNSG
jgi:uncharacterized protein involved in outer membrane biogenesis